MSTDDTMIKMKECLAHNVRREMEIRGWSQVKLAEKCGWPPPRITDILGGKKNYRLETVEILADAFGINPTSLLIPPVEKTLEKIPVHV